MSRCFKPFKTSFLVKTRGTGGGEGSLVRNMGQVVLGAQEEKRSAVIGNGKKTIC